MSWTTSATLVLVLALVPWIQFFAGQIVLAGTAWVSTAYMVGLALAIQLGCMWERSAPGEPAQVLFAAILLAAIASNGLALYQWLGLAVLDDIWVMQTSGRPFANLAQPNQLATLLCWGMIALMWLWGVRKIISTPVWIFSSSYLLFGIVLSGSRTSVVILLTSVLLLGYWRQHLRAAPWPKIIFGVFVYYIACSWTIPIISEQLGIFRTDSISPEALQARIASELRPLIWTAFADAAWQEPFFGYGWNQTTLAELKVLLDYPNLQVFFAHSHNLFLDLVLWMGIPLGGLVSFFLIWRLFQHIINVKTLKDALLVITVVAVGIHAMLELPLHYAYMLLPTGVVWGILESNITRRSMFPKTKMAHFLLWGVSAGLCLGLIRDYLNVQSSYEKLRYEWAGVAPIGSTPGPNVLFLTQWREFVKFEHVAMTGRPTPAHLRIMESLVGLSPSAGFLMRLAAAQAFNEQPDLAKDSLRRACQLHGPRQCNAIRQVWTQQAERFPTLAAVPLPQ